jgi:hypothetical protein
MMKLGIRVIKRPIQKYMRAVRKGTPGGQRSSTFRACPAEARPHPVRRVDDRSVYGLLAVLQYHAKW